MILYHGGCGVENPPRIEASANALDFGAGFYLTRDRELAKTWARCAYMRAGTGTPAVSRFEFDETDADGIKVLAFASPDREWLRFVVSNREGAGTDGDPDIVIGPAADERAVFTIGLYVRGIATEDVAAKHLLSQKLKDQYVFKTERALSNLKYMGEERV
ncbi:MAG: DUF3990 domain-containing protein [Clostridia bacterium]|nr:DUF3990 domain-containing protein [Clostridia bacterium]